MMQEKDNGLHQTNQNEERILRRIEVAFLAATLVAAIFAAVFTGQQADTAVTSLRLEHRPYVFVADSQKVPIVLSKGQKNVRWDLEMINYGKSPAFVQAMITGIWTGKGAPSKAQSFFKTLSLNPPQSLASEVIPPNATSLETGAHRTTLFSEGELSSEDFDFIANNDGGVVIAGRVYYYDTFGLTHTTDFCRYTLPSHAIAICPGFTAIR